MEVNTRLQVEHPVTEQTTGLDLVKLQLHVARGGRLRGRPPPDARARDRGRLCAEDPDNGFAPAPGRLAVLVTPDRPGDPGRHRRARGRRGGARLRLDDREDRRVGATTGLRRWPGSAARWHRPPSWSRAAPPTARSCWRCSTGRRSATGGSTTTGWTGSPRPAATCPPPDPVALLRAAVEAYEADSGRRRAAFHARAARGQPELPARSATRARCATAVCGTACGCSAPGRRTYRVDAGGTLADIAVDRLGRSRAPGRRRRAPAPGRRRSPTARPSASTSTASRTPSPGTTAASSSRLAGVRGVGPRRSRGDAVAAGDPLMVLESMKMEATVTAPFGGVVAAVEVAANAQVDAGAPLRAHPGRDGRRPADGAGRRST